MQRDNLSLIRDTSKISKDDENILREKFVSDYSRKKGWDKENLSPTQMLEIVQQNEYKNPGLILS
jgi:hypothetical protein